jgi:hypothetical protein
MVNRILNKTLHPAGIEGQGLFSGMPGKAIKELTQPQQSWARATCWIDMQTAQKGVNNPYSKMKACYQDPGAWLQYDRAIILLMGWL